jgi:M6 family metalloprotease-like protein
MTAAGADKLLILKKQKVDEAQSDNRIIQRGLTPDRYRPDDLQLKRKHPWSLPTEALADNAQHTIKVLVLRYDFQEEVPDDPNTTGRGVMNLADLPATPADSQAYLDSVGHFIDPPPHDSAYFHAHLRALNMYWEKVSEGKINLSWDIFPPGKNSRYQLPHPMSYYGKCPFDSVVFGLERFFIDCIHLADSMSPEISFSNYEAFFLFHAGADRQNDLGFPETCSDLFTGFIHYYPDPERGFDTLWVDSGTHFVETALLMPETASQDNRATALNAVIAHEFGHQLGLVDLYRTDNFMSQLGDFALMDNNGFGTGIETPWRVGRVFGAMPLYPSAWSRAYLGYVEVHDFRQGSDIRTVAAEVVSSGIKIARIPISENEYYLIENRMQLIDPGDTILWLDSTSNVILGPGNENHEFTGDYDFLMPGSGLLIFHVDEGVAGLDYDGDGMNNFDDNDLQRDPDRRFVRLVEADGLVNFGGYYRSGYGRAEDMFRDDRNNSFTPNTNPPAIDNSGNNTHVYVTNITRDTAAIGTLLDSVILFDLETDKLATGFPVRAGQPIFGLSPVADDLDRDGTDELIAVSGRNLLIFTTTGLNFLREYTGCTTCPIFYDTSEASVYPAPGRLHALPLYARVNSNITAGPVTGDFGDSQSTKYVAIGFPTDIANGRVYFYELADNNLNGLADSVWWFITDGYPIALSFGEIFYALTSHGAIYMKNTLVGPHILIGTAVNDQYHGLCRIGSSLLLLAGDSVETNLYYFSALDSGSFSLGNHYYNFGPILVDVNRDSLPEVCAFSPEGRGILVTVDTSGNNVSFSVLREVETGFHVTTNPVAGDIDNDGYPDIIIGGTNAIYAFNQELILKTNFPILVNDRFLDDDVIATPVVADIEKGGQPEVVFPTFVGNVYSFGSGLSYGFPLSGGEQVRGSDSTGWSGGYFGAGSPVIFSDSTGGKLGYLGADGWFYAWDVDLDTTTNYWPMVGHDPSGTFAFDQSQSSEPKIYTDILPEERFYNWPNPVTEGFTRIRYFLGKDARRVDMKIYDLSGQEIDVLAGPTSGGTDHECAWNCANVTPGVYRCVIEVNFGGHTETAFTDIAVIR